MHDKTNNKEHRLTAILQSYQEQLMDTKVTDIIAILAKGGLGAIPIYGPIFAEIIGSLIPNQRIDRIFSLLKTLESKIDEKERAKVEKRMLEEKSIDLMEDGFMQAARALSEERIEYIASLLKNSLTNEDLEHIAYKRLLFLLGELNDIEVFILKSHLGSIAEQQEFQRKHQDVLAVPRVYLGAPQEQVDEHAIYETYEANLVRLGLLSIRFEEPEQGELPELDAETGMLKAQGYDMTSLGKLLLRSIDQDGDAWWKNIQRPQ